MGKRFGKNIFTSSKQYTVDEFIRHKRIDEKTAHFLLYAQSLCDDENIDFIINTSSKNNFEGGFVDVFSNNEKKQLILKLPNMKAANLSDMNQHVRLLSVFFHEFRHNDQYDNIVSDNEGLKLNNFKNMFDDYLIFNTDEGYYRENYYKNIREIDANANGIFLAYDYLRHYKDIYADEIGSKNVDTWAFDLVKYQLTTRAEYNKLGMSGSDVAANEVDAQLLAGTFDSRFASCKNIDDVLSEFLAIETESNSSSKDLENVIKQDTYKSEIGEDLRRDRNKLTAVKNVFKSVTTGPEQDKYIASYFVKYHYTEYKENFKKISPSFDFDKYIKDNKLYFDEYSSAYNDFMFRLSRLPCETSEDAAEYRRVRKINDNNDSLSAFKGKYFMKVLNEHMQDVDFNKWQREAIAASAERKQNPVLVDKPTLLSSLKDKLISRVHSPSHKVRTATRAYEPMMLNDDVEDESIEMEE